MPANVSPHRKSQEAAANSRANAAASVTRPRLKRNSVGVSNAIGRPYQALDRGSPVAWALRDRAVATDDEANLGLRTPRAPGRAAQPRLISGGNRGARGLRSGGEDRVPGGGVVRVQPALDLPSVAVPEDAGVGSGLASPRSLACWTRHKHAPPRPTWRARLTAA